MKYLCLVYLEEDKLRTVPDSECVACGDGFRKSGLLIAAEALQPVDTATTVRVRSGRMSITDGPFGETKGTAVWRSMQIEQYSKAFARAGGVGIANEVYRTLIMQQVKRSA